MIVLLMILVGCPDLIISMTRVFCFIDPYKYTF